MTSYNQHGRAPLLTTLAWVCKKNWDKFRYGILLLLLFAGLLVFMRWALPVVIQPRLHSFFSIEDIQVSGKIEFAPLTRINEVLQNHIDQKALYQINVQDLSVDLVAIPWIEAATIQRVWPHELVVVVEETVPIALWNRGEILSNRGDVFQPENIETHAQLPSLIGSDSQVRIVTDMYRQTSKILRQARLKLVEIEYQQGLVWHLRVEDTAREETKFTVVLDGDKSFDRLYRFVSHYQSLSQMEKKPKRVDLRYPTGMAVSWHGE